MYSCSPNSSSAQVRLELNLQQYLSAVGVTFDIIVKINRHIVSQSVTMQHNNFGSKFKQWFRVHEGD